MTAAIGICWSHPHVYRTTEFFHPGFASSLSQLWHWRSLHIENQGKKKKNKPKPRPTKILQWNLQENVCFTIYTTKILFKSETASGTPPWLSFKVWTDMHDSALNKCMASLHGCIACRCILVMQLTIAVVLWLHISGPYIASANILWQELCMCIMFSTSIPVCPLGKMTCRLTFRWSPTIMKFLRVETLQLSSLPVRIMHYKIL